MSYPTYYPFSYYQRAFFLPWQYEMRERKHLRIITPAAAEPISLDEAALHLRVDSYGSPATYLDQDLIVALIPAAREYVEFLTGMFLAPQVVEVSARSFSGMSCDLPDSAIPLLSAPVTGIVSVTYLDAAGVDAVLDPANYLLDSGPEVPVLYPSYDAGSWPTGREQPGAIRIRMNVGFDAAGSSPTDNIIPYSLVAAMKLVLTTLYENRDEAVVGTIVSRIPLGVQALCARYTLRLPMA